MTKGDLIKVREIYKIPVEFKPMMAVMISCAELPEIKEEQNVKL